MEELKTLAKAVNKAVKEYKDSGAASDGGVSAILGALTSNAKSIENFIKQANAREEATKKAQEARAKVRAEREEAMAKAQAEKEESKKKASEDE